MLATGLYGQTLLPQNGAPLRLVVPWKYGFKSIKSIVKIDLVDRSAHLPVDDAAPRASTASTPTSTPRCRPPALVAAQRAPHRRKLGRRETLPFNGYAEEVAGLYAGMDLRQNY
jgi:sulfoxide reductase catalytic subunit YedY